MKITLYTNLDGYNRMLPKITHELQVGDYITMPPVWHSRLKENRLPTRLIVKSRTWEFGAGSWDTTDQLLRIELWLAPGDLELFQPGVLERTSTL